jgi:UDP-N-acetylglucosamine 2-epimerase
MPEELNRVVADHLSRWRFAPTPTAVENLAAEGISDGVSLVGDLMQDLAARVAAEVRDPRALGPISARLARWRAGLDLQPGSFLFATIHRAENRESQAIRAWARLLRAAARPERPVVLALHPGTRVALDGEGVDVGPDVIVVEPQGYRTSLALQLHAAAVLTDSGGVQRESGWLGTPCLVLRGTTEWVEALAVSGGRMAVVGLDAELAVTVLEREAPIDRAPALAVERATSLRLDPAGAADAILAALES